MQGGRSVRDESLLPTAGTKAIVKLPSCQTEVPSSGETRRIEKPPGNLKILLIFTHQVLLLRKSHFSRDSVYTRVPLGGERGWA